MTGIVLGNRYELIEQIDSGGMADIYKALCKKTNTIVAVKILKECFLDCAEYIDRFKREAEAVFSLEHENIVRVTDIGCDEDSYYMVMEYIEGSTLKAIIKERGRLSEKEAVEYGMQVCSALSAAHKKGIIHRDIKPQNVLVDNEGKLKLTDFGIAKSVASREDQEDTVIGSVHYISPEQARGEKVDARSDIYSLGIMMYEMVTGVLPHTGGKSVSVALKHINEQLTPPFEINESLSMSANNIILKATAKNKKDRYQSADELKKDLSKSLSDPEGTYVELPLAYRSTGVTTLKKRKNLIWKFGMLFLLLAVAGSLVTAGILVFGSAQEVSVVPNFVGLDIETVSKNLRNLSLTATYESSDSSEEGIVISQSPEAGSNAANVNSVVLTISSGPADPVMPDLAGMTVEEADALMNSIGVSFTEGNIVYEFHQDMPPGVVVSQMPEAGSPVTEEDIISIIASAQSDEPSAVMPDLSGKLVDQAVSFLKDSGFKTCFVYEDDSELPEGTVISQFPEKGNLTPYGEAVTLTVSRYKTRYQYKDFIASIDITEKESKVKIVVQENINGVIVSFIISETTEEAGQLSINGDLSSISRGKKNVVIYVNNVEADSGEVDFS